VTSSTDRLRVVIAEDEPLARRALRRMLLADPAVEVVAEHADIPALAAYLRATSAIDVLFLDVRMPGGSVFDCVGLLRPETLLVFTTAHAEHAAVAFDLDAADYLRKPFGAPRVHEALERVRRRRYAMPQHGAQAHLTGHVLVRVGVRDVPVRLASVWRFEGADDCVRVVTAERTWLHADTLRQLEQALGAGGFLRVHRRHLVNSAAIRALLPHDAHRLAVELPNGDRIVASRRGTSVLRLWAQRAGTAGTDGTAAHAPDTHGAGGTRR